MVMTPTAIKATETTVTTMNRKLNIFAYMRPL